MTEAQLKNLSDEELLRVVDNMMKLDLLALELARRLRDALDNADFCPNCGDLDGQNA